MKNYWLDRKEKTTEKFKEYILSNLGDPAVEVKMSCGYEVCVDMGDVVDWTTWTIYDTIKKEIYASYQKTHNFIVSSSGHIITFDVSASPTQEAYKQFTI